MVATSDGHLGGDQSRVERSGYTLVGQLYTLVGHLPGCLWGQLHTLKLSEGGLFPLADGHQPLVTSEGSCSCKGHTVQHGLSTATQHKERLLHLTSKKIHP